MAPSRNRPSEFSTVVQKSASLVFTRVPLWSLGIGFILSIMVGGAWLLKDQLVLIANNAESIAKLQSDIAHCMEMKDAMAREIEWLRMENIELQNRVAALEKAELNKTSCDVK